VTTKVFAGVPAGTIQAPTVIVAPPHQWQDSSFLLV